VGLEALIPMLRLLHKVIGDVMRGGDQMLPIIPCFGILEPVPYLGGSFRLLHRRRASYCIVGSLIGIYLNSTAALAKVEEVSKDLGGSSNSISTLPSGLLIDHLADDYDNVSDKDVVKFHLDEDLVPEAVWSLHNNGPVHLDRFRDGLESSIDTGTGGHFDSQNLWIRTAFGLWIGNSIYASRGLFPVPPLQFQLASCGGNHAEHRDLDYCSIGDDTLTQEIEQQNLSDPNDGNTRLEDANNNVISPKDTSSSSNGNDQFTPPLSTPTPVVNSPPHGGLIALDPCSGVSGVCVIVNVGLSVTPIDSPIVDSPPPLIDDLATTIDVLAPPIDVLAPPIDVLAPPPTQVALLNNPEPESGLPPIFTLQPVRPIPEASTWVMTIIGFSLMAFAFRKKRRPRFNPISIIDIS
jgi:PEP-CTERM motif